MNIYVSGEELGCRECSYIYEGGDNWREGGIGGCQWVCNINPSGGDHLSPLRLEHPGKVRCHVTVHM